jgi:hypothetical protein
MEKKRIAKVSLEMEKKVYFAEGGPENFFFGKDLNFCVRPTTSVVKT